MIVVVFHCLGQTPFRPSLRMALATVLHEMISPSPRRSARIFGEPETSSDSPWNQATLGGYVPSEPPGQTVPVSATRKNRAVIPQGAWPFARP